MDAKVLTAESLFTGNVCFELPPFQRPYVWTEEVQWQPLWDDIERVANRSNGIVAAGIILCDSCDTAAITVASAVYGICDW